jgi:serine/threonine-protein kinase
MHASNGDAQADPDPKRLARGGGAMSTDLHCHLEDLAPELVERLDNTCDRFEAEWKVGRRPRIKDHLSDAAETERATWLRELLALELDWRRRRGERPTPREYLNEFPEDQATIDAAFADASTSCRDRSGMGHSGDDTDPDHTKPGASRGAIAVLADPIARLLRVGALTPPVCPGAAARLGRFDILGVLGSGGMGIVLRACDPDSGEQVAIKLLKPDLAADPLALFLREAKHMA